MVGGRLVVGGLVTGGRLGTGGLVAGGLVGGGLVAGGTAGVPEAPEPMVGACEVGPEGAGLPPVGATVVPVAGTAGDEVEVDGADWSTPFDVITKKAAPTA